MPTQVQFRRGTTAQNNSFTGAAGELSINTSNSTIRVHDGSTPGGSELATVASTSSATNLTTGTLNSARLPTSGVSAATYGNATLIPSFTVDTFGRITSSSNVAISATVANTNITGNIIASQIAPTAVTSGSYGGTGNTVAIVVDPQGRITSASNVSTVTGVVAGTYGGATVEGVFTVDTYGRITSASNVTAQVANTNITGLITSGQIASVANTQITGTITAAQLQNTSVAAATYGNATNIPSITVDAQGRITSAANVAVVAGLSAGKSLAFSIVFGG